MNKTFDDQTLQWIEIENKDFKKKTLLDSLEYQKWIETMRQSTIQHDSIQLYDVKLDNHHNITSSLFSLKDQPMIQTESGIKLLMIFRLEDTPYLLLVSKPRVATGLHHFIELPDPFDLTDIELDLDTKTDRFRTLSNYLINDPKYIVKSRKSNWNWLTFNESHNFDWFTSPQYLTQTTKFLSLTTNFTYRQFQNLINTIEIYNDSHSDTTKFIIVPFNKALNYSHDMQTATAILLYQMSQNYHNNFQDRLEIYAIIIISILLTIFIIYYYY